MILAIQNYAKWSLIPNHTLPNDFNHAISLKITQGNPNLPLVRPKTKSNVLIRRKTIRTKIPFGQNSSKNRFASSYHVPHTLPIKTHKFRAKNHPNTPPKINNFVRPFMRKMQQNKQIKEERESRHYLRQALRSSWKRERRERWSDGGERVERER